MTLQLMTVRLHLPHVHSLKEKRMVLQSLIARIQNKFHLSVIEADEQDIHQVAVIAVAALGGSRTLTDSILDRVIDLIDENEDALITDILREER